MSWTDHTTLTAPERWERATAWTSPRSRGQCRESEGTCKDSKGLSLGITFVTAKAAELLPTFGQTGGNDLRKAKGRKENLQRGHFDSTTFAFETLAFPIRGDIGEDTISHIDEMSHHRVDSRVDCFDEKEGKAAVGREASKLRRQLSSVLDRALAQQARLPVAETNALPPDGRAGGLEQGHKCLARGGRKQARGGRWLGGGRPKGPSGNPLRAIEQCKLQRKRRVGVAARGPTESKYRTRQGWG